MRYFDLIYCLEGLVILAKEKKMVEEITSMSEDFAQWYTDIIKKAQNYAVIQESEYCDMVIQPYGYAIWENIQKIMDKRLKETGVQNVSMPMFIPESLFAA